MRTVLGVPLAVLLIALGATACARDDVSGAGSTVSDTAARGTVPVRHTSNES